MARPSPDLGLPVPYGIPFVSDVQLQAAPQAMVDPKIAQAVLEVNEHARLDGLRSALVLLTRIFAIALFSTKRIPQEQPGSADGRQLCVTLKDPCFTRLVPGDFRLVVPVAIHEYREATLIW